MPTQTTNQLFRALLDKALARSAQGLSGAITRTTDPVSRELLKVKAEYVIRLSSADLSSASPSTMSSLRSGIESLLSSLWEADAEVRGDFGDDRPTFDGFVALAFPPKLPTR